LGNSTQIFTHVLYYNYRTPLGLNWDTNGNDDPFVDNANLTTFNADNKTDTLFEWVMHMKDHYVTNHLFITMGEDFNY
jgi:hypothetical protein